MRLLFLLVAAILMSTPAIESVFAQTPSSSSVESTPVAAPSDPVTADGAPPALPMSLDHIREALNQPADGSLLSHVSIPADFRIQIVEQRKIDEMLSKLDFRGGPVPAGGLYSFEQQQRLFKPTSRPLMQPYAAYNGGQFATVALENLLGQYLAGPLIKTVTTAARTRAEREARDEVDQEIAAYCAARPDRAQIQLCTLDPPAR